MLYAITTYDNPYDPLDDFINWFNFDSTRGYDTCKKLSAFAYTSPGLSDYENKLEIEHAIDQLVAINPLLYKKIVKEEESKG